MPSKYIKKTNRRVRSPEDVLEKATKLINEEGFSYRKAAEYFGIDKMILMRFKKKKEANPNCAVGYKSTSIKNRIISPDMEPCHSHWLLGRYVLWLVLRKMQRVGI